LLVSKSRYAARPDVSPDNAALDDLVVRIVTASHPQKIILFGSAARGEMNDESDLDVLVVLPETSDRRSAKREIRSNLWQFEYPVDVITATERELAEYKSHPGLMYGAILEEGRVIYAADEH